MEQLDDLDLTPSDLTPRVNSSSSYTKRLSKVIQLTGYSDPVYAEAFVDFHKYDINFEILLVNRTKEMLQNV